jgi:hypothetical protein
MQTPFTVITAQAVGFERAAEAAMAAGRLRRLHEEGAPAEAPGLLARVALRLRKRRRLALAS